MSGLVVQVLNHQVEEVSVEYSTLVRVWDYRHQQYYLFVRQSDVTVDSGWSQDSRYIQVGEYFNLRPTIPIYLSTSLNISTSLPLTEDQLRYLQVEVSNMKDSPRFLTTPCRLRIPQAPLLHCLQSFFSQLHDWLFSN